MGRTFWDWLGEHPIWALVLGNGILSWVAWTALQLRPGCK